METVLLEHEQQVSSLLSSSAVEIAECSGERSVVGHLSRPGEVPEDHSLPTLHSGHTPTPYNTRHIATSERLAHSPTGWSLSMVS